MYRNFKEKSDINAVWDFHDINHFNLTIETEKYGYNKFGKKTNFNKKWLDTKLRLICLTPKFTLQQLSSYNPRSIIFTSGTLQPMEDYENNFGTSFKTKFSCGHVINTKEQLKVAVIKNFPEKIQANFSYQMRSNPKLIEKLGSFIYRMAQITPKGMVVFFPSYAVMEDYYEKWKNSRILYQIQRLKVLCKEERNNKKFKNSFNQFLSNYQTKGAIFFGVTSGKLSEGIDFTDEMARMVMIIGVPFPSIKDLRIEGKKEYLDKIKSEKKKQKVEKANSLFDGNQWYFVSALRATNQAIGRIIRHKKDFGSIIMIDQRYSYNNYRKEISNWVSKEIKVYEDSDDSVFEIENFYKNAENFCSKFEVKETLKGKSLQQRILEGNELLKIDVGNIKNLKRSSERYKSLDSEKELKREKRNEFYKKKEEKLKNKMINKDVFDIESSEDDIEEVEEMIPLNHLLFKKKKKKEIVSVEEKKKPEEEEVKRVITSDKIDYIPDLYNMMIPKERKALIEKERLEKLQCLICYNVPEKPAGAKCGHVACTGCWEGQLKLNKMECPACRKKVRSKNLIFIFEEKKPMIIEI